MLDITLDHLTAFLRSAHSAALQHQLRWTACVASKEGRKISPAFLPITANMEKEIPPTFDLLTSPLIGPGKGRIFRFPPANFWGGEKGANPPARQPPPPPQGGIAAATYPDIDFFCRSGGNSDMRE